VVEGLTLLGGPRQATMSAGCMQIAVTSATILARPRRCAWLVELHVTVVSEAVTMPSAQLDAPLPVDNHDPGRFGPDVATLVPLIMWYLGSSLEGRLPQAGRRSPVPGAGCSTVPQPSHPARLSAGKVAGHQAYRPAAPPIIDGVSRGRRATSTRYQGKIAVVTGASSGIGRRLALDLAHRGATVVGLARRAGLLAELEGRLKAATPANSTRVCDVGDSDRYRAVLGEIEGEHARIDILVNDAGIEQLTPVEEGLSDAYRRIFDVNFFAVVAGTLAVLPGMLARRSGIVVNVSSDSARAPEPRHGAYAASKAAVSAFTETVAHEVADRGVRVHVLYPPGCPRRWGCQG
jgi:NADP-dependent 3-hydroxy acid dehydrogenase YdfG